MNKTKKLLKTIKRNSRLKQDIKDASQELKPKESVYIRYISMGFNSINFYKRRKKPLSYFGLATVIEFASKPIDSFSHLNLIVEERLAKFDSDNMTYL